MPEFRRLVTSFFIRFFRHMIKIRLKTLNGSRCLHPTAGKSKLKVDTTVELVGGEAKILHRV
jgi:hypothetical protein